MSTPRNYTNLIIESDCLLVVEEINQHERPTLVVGNILLDIRELMSAFPNRRIQYGNHIDNMVAHLLARNA